MEISIFEIVAQIINFFLLLFILNKLFYGPVLKAMEDRRVRIFKAEKEADEKMKQAEILIKDYDKKILRVENKRKSIIDSYRAEALEEKDNLLKEYKEEAKTKRELYLNEVEEEKDYFIKRLRKELGKNAVEIASKILSTISSKELEDEVFKSFISDLKLLGESIPDKEILNQESQINLYSSTALSEKQKNEIEDALKESISNVEGISYKQKEDLILGYELNLETYTIHNSIKTYLNEVEDNIINLLESLKS